MCAWVIHKIIRPKKQFKPKIKYKIIIDGVNILLIWNNIFFIHLANDILATDLIHTLK